MAKALSTPEQFVKAWQSSESVLEVAQKLGEERTNLYARASYLRSKGVLLKRFSKMGARLDLDALNKLCK